MKGFEKDYILAKCGRKDMFYKRNVRIKNKLQALGADVTWLDTEWGAHNLEFTNSVLDEVFLWLKK